MPRLESIDGGREAGRKGERERRRDEYNEKKEKVDDRWEEKRKINTPDCFLLFLCLCILCVSSVRVLFPFRAPVFFIPAFISHY